MKKHLLIAWFGISCLSAAAQIVEDFNDGDWSNGVSWNAS
ncbi:MAG: hypothetical protein RL160_1062, partial [Bacteroidota bacterium]